MVMSSGRGIVVMGCVTWWALMFALAGSVMADLPPDPVIVSIEVDSESPATDLDVIEILGLEVGRMLELNQVRRGIQILMAGGEFSWIRVSREAVSGGIAVTVEVDVHPRLTELDIQAPSVFWEFRVRRWFDVEVGDPVNPERIESAARRVRRRIERMGYPDAAAEPYLELAGAGQWATATLEVRPGDRAALAGIELTGLPGDIDRQAVMPSFRPGRKLSDSVLENLEGHIQNTLRAKGFWEAKVIGIERTGPAAASILTFDIDTGRRYRFELSAPPGTVAEVERMLPDPVEEILNPAQTDVLAESVEERLQEQGWPLAEVSVTLLDGADETVVSLDVNPGPRAQVAILDFPGAEQVEVRRLKRLVDVEVGAGSKRKPLTAEQLEQDRASIENWYRRNGYQDVSVGLPMVRLVEQSGALHVSFPVDEGLQWFIDGFSVEGAPAEALARTDDDLYQLEVTQPWNPPDLDVLMERWGRALSDVGYPEAQVTADVTTPEAGRVVVLLRIDPGPFVRIGHVRITGLTQTKTSVVERSLHIAGLEQGAPYSSRTILEAQQELYRLGLFRRVSIVPIPGQERRLERGLVIQLEEGLQRSYLLGLGWGTDDQFRVTLGWSHLNLFGGAHALSLETRYSSREFRYQAGLREPTLPVIDQPGYFALYRTEETYSDWELLRYGFWFEAGDRLAAPFRHWVRYEYQLVEPDAPASVLSELERENQQIELSSITVPFEWDYRNDLLSPTSGFLVTLAPEVAFPFVDAEAEFLKIRAGISHYIPTGEGHLRWGVRVGAIRISGRDSDEAANLQVPLASRFFAGGPNSHRAFKTDRLGIPGETLSADGRPIGGAAEVLVNIEFSRPIWNALNGVLFIDGGNVWSEWSDVDVGGMRWGAGAGLRFETPAGPFRLEYGRKLEVLPGESPGEYHLTFGMAF